MPRVIPADVLAIRATTADPLPFILTATQLVDRYCVSFGLSETFLAEVERWWSAHLMEVASPQVTQQKLGDTSLTFAHGKLGDGLASTRYGQQLLAMVPDLMTVTTLKTATFDVF
jgi:hypothetical protein